MKNEMEKYVEGNCNGVSGLISQILEPLADVISQVYAGKCCRYIGVRAVHVPVSICLRS
jgi:hypothetical protein